MYVCLCNGFTERDVRACACEVGGSVAEVYKRFGCTPRCGKCIPAVREILAEAGREGEAPPPVPADWPGP